MALAVVVVAAACGGDDGGSKAAPAAAQPFEFSGNAATLDGEAIPAQVLADQIDAFRKAPEAAQTALHVDQLYQDNSDQPAPEVVSDLLTTEIAVKAIDAELAARGISATDANRDVASVQVKASFGSTADKLPPTFVQQTIDRYANFVALDQALAVQPTEDEIAKQYAAHPRRVPAGLRAPDPRGQRGGRQRRVGPDPGLGPTSPRWRRTRPPTWRARPTAATSAAWPRAASATTSRRRCGTRRSASSPGR